MIDTLGTRPLTGVSHGASEIAAALARLDTVVPREAYCEAARRVSATSTMVLTPSCPR